LTELNKKKLDFHFKPDMIDFMLNIRFNNNKAFMHENRDEYIRKVRSPYYEFIEALTPTALEIDPQMEVRPVKVLSRIFRDTRFSRDKSPYRDHHWVAFRRQGEPREKSLMLWFEIKVESVAWGMGFWGENRPAMDVLRRRMLANPDELIQLSNSLEKQGITLAGDTFKRLPIPENLNSRLVPWYIRKELLLMKQGIKSEWVFEPGIVKRVSDDFLALKPVYQLLRGCYDISM
jgi:uncharacterized protein (TIGR02453 family)